MTNPTINGEEVRLIEDMGDTEMFMRAERGIPLIRHIAAESFDEPDLPEPICLLASVAVMAFTAYSTHFTPETEASEEKSAGVIHTIVMGVIGAYKAGAGHFPEDATLN